MRKVDDYIKEKMKNDPDFKARYDLIKEKVAVVKKVIGYRLKLEVVPKYTMQNFGLLR